MRMPPGGFLEPAEHRAGTGVARSLEVAGSWRRSVRTAVSLVSLVEAPLRRSVRPPPTGWGQMGGALPMANRAVI